MEQVNEVTSAKLTGLARVAAATHALVNNAMGMQLKAHALMARELAALRGDPASAKVAEVAEEAYLEHQRKQSLVDAQPGTDDEKTGRSM